MSAKRSTARLFTHPLWIGSLTLLALNDHLFKGSGLLPGWLTGKLSDVAGMFVAPAVVALLLRVTTARGLGLAHAAVGVSFAALEMSATLTATADRVYGVFGRSWGSTRDWTDLLALGLLPLAYVWAERASRISETSSVRRGKTQIILAGAGLLACVATSDDGGVTSPSECEVDCDMDGWDAPEDCNDFNVSVNPSEGNCPGAEDNEACDNGTDDDSDGMADCSDSDCTAVCSDTFAACAEPLPIEAQSGVLEGSTLIGTWALEGRCGGSDAPENIYLLTAPFTGRLTVSVPEGHVVYGRQTCTVSEAHVPSDEGFLCTDGGETGEDMFVADLEMGSYVFVVVDASDGLSAADYTLDVQFLPIGCGDGAVDPSSEECDDGNSLPDDGCSATCTVERPSR